METEQDCQECVAEVDHCHGTLVRHHTAVVECSEAGCASADPARHLWVLDCELVDGACTCTPARVALRLVS